MSDDPAADADRALMRRVQSGETSCFAELIRPHQAALLRVAQSRLGQAEAAEDAVQETLLAAFKSRHTYDERFGFRTWLWTILLNQCRRQGARQSRIPTVASWSDCDPPGGNQPGGLPLDPVASDTASAPLARLLAQEQAATLQHLLGQLNETQADALRLRFFAGLKFDEIAGTMQCTPCTAKNRVKAGLLRLAEMLAQRPQTQTDSPR